MDVNIANSDFPGYFQAADTASKDAKKAYFRFMVGFLGTILVAAVATLFADESQFMAIISASLFLLSFILTIVNINKRFDRIWYRSRSIAESVKTMTWRYIMKSQPYHREDALVKFTKEIDKLINNNRDFYEYIPPNSANLPRITSMMKKVRELNLEERISFYLRKRVNQQMDWYTRNAEYNSRMSKKWNYIMWSFQAAAVGSAVLRIIYANWEFLPTDIFAVATTSVLSWSQSKRYQELAMSYYYTANEVGTVQTLLEQGGVKDEKNFSDFVGDAENAFSREHTQWLARKDY